MWLKGLYRRVRALICKEAIHNEIDEEMRFHIDMREEENVRQGMSPEEARRDAERRFGRFTRVKEQGYEVRGGRWLESLWQDCRYGTRMLWKNFGFTTVAVLVLALGIGANTSLFSVVNAVLLRPLPFPDAERIIWFDGVHQARGITASNLSPADYSDWEKQASDFESMSAYVTGSANLSDEVGEPERVPRVSVTAGFFPTLGASPALGRALLPEDESPGGEDVAILSHALWQRRFGASPGVVGTRLLVNGTPVTVVGVMPAGFDFPRASQMWTPLKPEKSAQKRDNRYLNVLARLKPDVTLEEAETQLGIINSRLGQQYPETNGGWSVRLTPLHERTVRDVSTSLWLLLGAVGFVLLIACANVTNLLLARAAGRRREIALRTALGAGRLRVIRQLLTESLMLATLGGAVGLVLSFFLMDLLVSISPANLPRLNEVSMDWRVLGFTAGAVCVVGLLFGIAPALQASKTDLNEVLKEGSFGSSGGLGRNRVRAALVISEVALSLLLLVGAGLLIRSFLLLHAVDAGFDPEKVLTMRVSLPSTRYSDPQQRVNFFRQLTERVEALPGVEAAGAAISLPLGGTTLSVARGFVREGNPLTTEHAFDASYNVTTPGYIKTMRIPLKSGRVFTDRDAADAPPVAIINESLARRAFPDIDPVGKRLTAWRDEEFAREIVGVVADVKMGQMEGEDRPQVYVPQAQNATWGALSLAVRTSVEPESLAGAVREAVLAIDKSQPVYDIRTMEDVRSASVANRRLIVLLFAGFATLAFLLAVVGIYGVLSYAVTQRTHEIGIRLALGAQRADVLRLVVGQGMRLVVLGVAVGMVGAFLVTRLLKSLLFGVSAADPVTFAVVALVLSVVGLLACYIPARRATRVDPLIALRNE
ncbi:MAG TPA: ABC transporter permease [Pyrinomonadaceae bacterium]|jgi:putative ABC transport system permease protein